MGTRSRKAEFHDRQACQANKKPKDLKRLGRQRQEKLRKWSIPRNGTGWPVTEPALRLHRSSSPLRTPVSRPWYKLILPREPRYNNRALGSFCVGTDVPHTLRCPEETRTVQGYYHCKHSFLGRASVRVLACATPFVVKEASHPRPGVKPRLCRRWLHRHL